MMKKLVPAFCVIIMMAFAVPVMAQGADDADYQKRVELARQMHEIRPINMQVEDIVIGLADRFPPDKQELFISRMMQVFDKKTLNDISIKAMADTFTVVELQKMVDFHGSPEGKAVDEKMPVYQALVGPELEKRIDAALMTVRTGSSGHQ